MTWKFSWKREKISEEGKRSVLCGEERWYGYFFKSFESHIGLIFRLLTTRGLEKVTGRNLFTPVGLLNPWWMVDIPLFFYFPPIAMVILVLVMERDGLGINKCISNEIMSIAVVENGNPVYTPSLIFGKLKLIAGQSAGAGCSIWGSVELACKMNVSITSFFKKIIKGLFSTHSLLHTDHIPFLWWKSGYMVKELF